MKIITTTHALEQFCQSAGKREFCCIDTEFIREHSFYSQLCLVQLATDESCAIIDPLAKGLDLTPLAHLLQNEKLTKILHAGQQDIEIFFTMFAQIPKPVFDTQIAAMVLGYGDSVSYINLVKGRLGLHLNKEQRFSDWSLRPLSDAQLNYALGDVTYLRDLYPAMKVELQNRGRDIWIEPEMQALLDPDQYRSNPEDAWQRLKPKNRKPAYLASLKAICAWREQQAQTRNMPRRRILKDETVQDIAQNRPRTLQAIGRLRSVSEGFSKSTQAKSLLEALTMALENIQDYAPLLPLKRNYPADIQATVSMLHMLLQIRCTAEQVCPRLVASNDDINQIATYGEKADIATLTGWRRTLFGEEALALRAGKITLRLSHGQLLAESIV